MPSLARIFWVAPSESGRKALYFPEAFRNSGQLSKVLRAEFLVDIDSYAKVKAQPLFAAELEKEIVDRV